MANSEFTVRVRVQGGADVDAVRKALEGLGATVTRTRERTAAAGKSQEDFYDTQKKGIIGTANSTKSFSKLAETIGSSGSSGLVGAYATLAANAFALTAAFNALRSASQVEQIFKGLEAAGVRTGRSLTATAMGLKEVTGNAISTEQALRSTAQIASAGFGSDSIERLGRAARDTSFALGRNMTDSLDRLSRGVVKLEPELLDELGIMTKLTESNTLYASKLGKTEGQLTNFEKRQGFLNAVLTEAELKFGGLADSAGDTTAYDRLSAKLTDLSNTTLNTANSVAKPIATLLASSSGLILGLVVSLASSLRTQLVPGLARAATAAAAQAESLRALAREKVLAIQSTRELARAEAEQALASRKNFDYIGTTGPKIYQQLAASVRAGTASMADQRKALTSLQRSFNMNSIMIDNNPNFAPGTARGDAKIAQNAAIQQEMNAIRQLQAAQAQADTADVEGSKKVQAARAAARLATRQALAQSAAAASLGAASQLKLGESWKQLVLSTKAYASAQAMASTDGVTAMTKLRVAAFAASTGVRAIGTAFLAALPYLGLIITGLGLLQAGLEALKSKRVVDMEKALNSLSDSTGKTEQYVKELNRTNNSTASIALRTAQAITIQSNAISETTDKFQELIEASGRYNDTQNKNKSGISGFWDTDNLRGIVSYTTQVDKASKAIEVFGNNVGFGGRNLNSDPVMQGAIKSLDSIINLAPDATEEAVKFYGGWDKITKLPYEQKVGVIGKILTNVNERTKAAAANVTALQEAFKALDQSLADFTLASVQTSQFDQAVKGFNSVTNAINDFRESAILTGKTDYKNLLAGIGPSSAKFLQPDTQAQLQQLQRQDALVQSLKSQHRESELIAKEEAVRDSLSTKVLGNVEQQIFAARQMFLNAQLQSREYKTQLDLLNAHIQANSALYTAAGAGLKARINREEQVRGIQAQQIKSELAIQEAGIARLKIRQQELEAARTLSRENAIILAQEVQREELAYKSRIARSGASVSAVEDGRLTGGAFQQSQEGLRMDPNERKQIADTIDNYRSFMVFRKRDAQEQLANSREMSAIQDQIRDSQSAINNLNGQLAVLSEQNLTSAQKLAQIREADVTFQNQLYSTLKDQKSAVDEISRSYSDIDSIINGTNDSINYQVKAITAAAEAQKSQTIATNNAQITALKAQIDTARAAANRPGLNKDEKEAGRVLVQNLESQLALQNQQQQIDLARIDSQTTLNIAQKVYFDTMKEGLDWQQTSLDYLNKQLDAQKSLSDEVTKGYELRIRLDAKRRGLEVSPQAERAIEINSAKASLDIAIRESEIKKASIDLEYALLDAQKAQLVSDLQARKERLADDPRNATRIAQLNATIERLESVNTNAIATAAKVAVDKSVDNARLTLQTALTPTAKGGFFGDLVSVVTGAKQLRDQVAAARSDVVKPISVAPIVAAETQAQRDILATSVTNPLVSSNNLLMERINEWIKSVEQFTRANQSAVTTGGTGRVAQALEFFTKNGFSANQAAGLVGNLQQESSADLDPTKRNRTSGAYGIGQWLSKSRIDDFARTFGHSIQQSTFEEQLKFILHELNGTEKAAGNALRNANTLADATRIVREKYERPGRAEANDARRLAYAQANVRSTPVVAANATVPVSGAVAANDNVAEDIVVVGKKIRQGIETTSEYNSILDKTLTKLDLVNVSTVKAPRDFTKVTEAITVFDQLTSKTMENLKSLGPDGEYVASIFEGMSSLSSGLVNVFQQFDDVSGTGAQKFADRFTAIAGVAASALSTVQSALAASAQSKEDAVQREIDAETKRDGKSAESVAKIAALEKKKDQIAKQQFNTNKKLQMAQAVIATAAGVAQALTMGPIVGPILAGVIGAMGAAQIAIIAGTQYQSSASSATAATAVPSTLTIGKRGDTVDLAKQNNNVGGELGYLRGRQGTGSNASNYSVVGSAYGGDLPRGYGNTAYVVGEKGPETITPETAITVRPANDNAAGTPTNATINIHALDASGVEDVLTKQSGNIITLLRKAANANGHNFLENVNVNTYSRPNSANRL